MASSPSLTSTNHAPVWMAFDLECGQVRSRTRHQLRPPDHVVVLGDRRPRLALVLGLPLLLDPGQLVDGERQVVTDLGDHHLLQAHLVADLADRRVQDVEDDQRVDAGVRELVRHLALGVEGVVPHRNGPQALDRVERHHVLGAVRKHHSDPVALADSLRHQGAGEPLRLLNELPVGQPPGHRGDGERDGGGVRVLAGALLEQPPHRLLGKRGQGVRDVWRVGRQPRTLAFGHLPRAPFSAGNRIIGALRPERQLPLAADDRGS